MKFVVVVVVGGNLKPLACPPGPRHGRRAPHRRPPASVAAVAELAPALLDPLAAGEGPNTPAAALMPGTSASSLLESTGEGPGKDRRLWPVTGGTAPTTW
jgi:hypothetical protein